MSTNQAHGELTTIEPNEPSQLITLKPEKYVAEVFNPFKKALSAAIKNAAKTPEFDITTKPGMEVAKTLRGSFKALRTGAENTRKERKAPILEIGKLLDTKYKELEAEIKPHEDKYDALIKAEEQRLEEEKQKKIAEERARIEAIENRLAQIRNVPLQLSAASSEDVRTAIAEWSDKQLVPDDFDEFLEDAINAVNATLVELEKVRVRAVDREAAEEKAAAERAELARLREEKRKQDAEDKAKREAEEAEKRKQLEELEALKRQLAEANARLAAAEAPKEEPPAEEAPAVQLADVAEAVMPEPVKGIFADIQVLEAPAAAAPLPGAEDIITALMSAFNLPRHNVLYMLTREEWQDFT